MKKISELAQSASVIGLTKSQSETSKKTDIPTSWVSALFKHFQVIYGHKFTTIIDGLENLAVQEWSVALEGLTGDQIKSGLRMCGTRKIANGSQDWPPTPAEFRAMCLPEIVPAIHRDYLALPKPPQDKDVVEKSLAGIRDALRR